MKKLYALILACILLFAFSACKDKEPTYTLFYNTNGGVQIPSVKLKKNEVVDLPTPVKVDQEFLGWYIDDSFQTKVNEPFYINKDTVIYACWKTPDTPPPPKTHANVTFKITGEKDTVLPVELNTSITEFPDKTKSGYHLLWYVDSAYTQIFIPQTVISEDTIIYGLWKAIFNVKDASIVSVTPYGKTLSQIVVPENINGADITSLSSDSFRKCPSLKTVTISKNIEEIASRPFFGCDKLEDIIVDEENAHFVNHGGALYTKDLSKLITFPKSKQISEFSINTNTVFIANDAFGNCKKINKIIMNSALETIDIQAFTGCEADILFSIGITKITKNAFSGYEGTSIILQNGITEIEEYAFKNCLNLTHLTIPNTTTMIREKAFYGCSSLETLVLPQNIETIYGDAFWGCASLNEITINSITPPILQGDIMIPENIVFYVHNKGLYEAEDSNWKNIQNQIINIDDID